jgi:hypothetical protein
MRFKIFTRHAERKIPNERYVPPLLVFVLFLHEKILRSHGACRRLDHADL